MSQTFLFLAISVLSTVIAQLLLKKGTLLMGKLEFSLPNLLNLFVQVFHNIYLFLGLIFFGIAFLFWLFILSKIQLNVIYPVSTSLTLCLVTLASWFLFKEYLSFYQILGIGLVVLGVFLLLKPFQ